MNPNDILLLKEFVKVCKHDPNVLYNPELSFYKEWLERYLLLFKFTFLHLHFVICNQLSMIL